MGDGQLILMSRKKEEQIKLYDIVYFQKISLDKKYQGISLLIHVSHLFQLQVSPKKTVPSKNTLSLR